MQLRRAFTVVELLVVISLITLIIGMILPSMQQSREAARGVKCGANLRQLGYATDAFTVEHIDRLPGIWASVWVKPSVPGGGCWMSNPTGGQSAWQGAPHTGEVFGYAGRDPAIYRCPSIPEGPLGSGENSNGRFDYSAFHSFAGARVTRLPSITWIPVYGDQRSATPWLIEESPRYYINTLSIEGGFGGGDRIGNWHNGGGNLLSFDSSVRIIPNSLDLSSNSFNARAPSGAIVNLASHGSGWGGWDSR